MRRRRRQSLASLRTTCPSSNSPTPEGIRPYSAAVESTFIPFGGRYVVRGGKVTSLEGEPTKRVIVIAFPSMQQAQAWYDSPRYREIMPIRHKSARSRVFIMEGFSN